MNTKTLCKMSLIINKMGISSVVNKMDFPTSSKEELGKEIIKAIIDNLYKAENEIIELMMIIKGITKEEAENEDVIAFIKELFSNDKLKSFLSIM